MCDGQDRVDLEGHWGQYIEKGLSGHSIYAESF